MSLHHTTDCDVDDSFGFGGRAKIPCWYMLLLPSLLPVFTPRQWLWQQFGTKYWDVEFRSNEWRMARGFSGCIQACDWFSTTYSIAKTQKKRKNHLQYGTRFENYLIVARITWINLLTLVRACVHVKKLPFNAGIHGIWVLQDFTNWTEPNQRSSRTLHSFGIRWWQRRTFEDFFLL